ncbi:MAG: cbb3-type cytochrome oxidase assembly protein CcoS [Bacteroidota bacterium]
MSAIYLLIGFSLLVAVAFLLIFLWAMRSGQYEDSYTPAVRMLFDDGTVSQDSPSPEPTELEKR